MVLGFNCLVVLLDYGNTPSSHPSSPSALEGEWLAGFSCQDGFAMQSFEAAQLACEGVDAVGVPLDDERDDGHLAFVERETLSTEYNIGEFGNESVDFRRPGTVGNEYGDCTYSLFHQGLSFWVR